MQQERLPRVAITHGDTNAVGYEVIFKAFEDPTMLELCTPIVYGASKVADYHAKVLGLEPQFNIIRTADEAQEGRLNLLSVTDEEVKINLGEATPESGQVALMAINRALDDYQHGAFDVLVTCPVNKNSIPGFNGHSAYIEQRLGSDQHGLTILLNEDLRVALATNNVSLKDVAEVVTKQKIVEKATLLQQALRRDLRISNPRIAVLGLNPRCGEDGELGTEEQEVIIPAIAELAASGIQAFGPYAADDFFGSCAYYRFDAVLAMYHDQGQTPFKALALEGGVRFTSGLSIVRTAPAHGTFFQLAGRNKTEERSLRNAIYTAIDIFRNRINFDEPLANPLPKLYHEKRDESEKVRFRAPGDNPRENSRENSRENPRENNRENSRENAPRPKRGATEQPTTEAE